MSIDFEAVALPAVPEVVALPPPAAFSQLEAPVLEVAIGPPAVDFVSLGEPDGGAIQVVVGAPPQQGGSGERIEFTVVAGFTLQAYRLVVPRVMAPNVRHALPNFPSHANRPLWLTLHPALAGEHVRVIAAGIVQNADWDWHQAPIYLGPDGTLTQTVPETPTAAFAVQVGYPVDPDSFYLGPGPAIILTA